MVPTIPCELILHICSFLTNPKDVRSLSLINKDTYTLIHKYFISKEKWVLLSLKNDNLIIKTMVNLGIRFIFHNNRFQYIYNLRYDENSTQIMTEQALISTYDSFNIKRKGFLETKVKFLTYAPYNLKKKYLKI